MNDFKNEFSNPTIDISSLPKFEHAKLESLQKNYLKVMYVQLGIVYLLLLAGLTVLYVLNEPLFVKDYFVYLIASWSFLLLLNFFFIQISFAKKGFALREHDVVFQSGVISQTTTIVTNNRVQHVALHQGVLSRMYGLASIELFTAGGSTSDLKIKGLRLEDAMKIKESVSLKINELNVESTEEIS